METSAIPPSRSHLEEDDGNTQEFKEIFPSLPKEQAWIVNLYQYQGFWYGEGHLQGTFTSQKHFPAHNTDLLLVTTPKSGTTWLKAMVFAIANRVRYSYSDHPLLTNNPHDLVPFLQILNADSNKIPELIDIVPPRLFSTHVPFMFLPKSVMASKCKLVYLCRNPKDAFVSLWHFANKLRAKTIGPLSLEEAFEMFCRGVTLCGPFWDHVLGNWRESLAKPERIFFHKYEDIKGEPQVKLKRLAEFLGYPFSSNEEKGRVLDEILSLCSLEILSNLEVNKTGKSSVGTANSAFFRRGEVRDWENYLTSEMIETMDRITEYKLRGSGLKF